MQTAKAPSWHVFYLDEEILSVGAKAGKWGPKSKIECELEQVSRLPNAKRKLVSDFLETVL